VPAKLTQCQAGDVSTGVGMYVSLPPPQKKNEIEKVAIGDALPLEFAHPVRQLIVC